MNTDSRRIKWADGLKGVACLLVFTHHFFLAFYPASFYGDVQMSVTDTGWDVKLASSPFGFVINGNFWVCVFFLLAGFFAAYNIFSTPIEKTQEKASKSIMKRYPRLMLPSCFVGVLYYFVLHIVGRNTEFGLIKTIWKYVVSMWVFPECTGIIGPFWSLYYLLWGTILAIVMALVGRNGRPYMPLIYLGFLYVFIDHKFNYFPFVLGVFIADIISFRRWEKFILKHKPVRLVLGIVLSIAGLFFGGYPSSALGAAGVYGFLQLIEDHFVVESFIIVHSFAALLLVAGIALIYSVIEKGLLSSGVCTYLGTICMPVFLLHAPVEELLGYTLLGAINAHLNSYHVSAVLTYIVLLVVIIGLSQLYKISVQRIFEK